MTPLTITVTDLRGMLAAAEWDPGMRDLLERAFEYYMLANLAAQYEPVEPEDLSKYFNDMLKGTF